MFLTNIYVKFDMGCDIIYKSHMFHVKQSGVPYDGTEVRGLR